MDLSIIIPCLNEEETLEKVLIEAKSALLASGLTGEVLVADNFSSDSSRAIAESLGVRTIIVPERGYGSVLNSAVRVAKGRWVLIGDADASYDFSHLNKFSRFFSPEREAICLVVGSRLAGKIDPGAMPKLHRYVGIPFLNCFIYFAFRIRTTDCFSGMRAFKRDFVRDHLQNAKGMEWACIMFTLLDPNKGGYVEVPIHFRRDNRTRPPHLRTWRDGFRTLFALMRVVGVRIVNSYLKPHTTLSISIPSRKRILLKPQS